MSLMPSHLVIPVHDLPAVRCFCDEVFDLSEGRSAEYWVDFDFFDRQLVIHQRLQTDSQRHVDSNPVDGHDVSVLRFGVVLTQDDWHALIERPKQCGAHFMIGPHIHFKSQVGEQATLFLSDPRSNVLEFKSFRGLGQLPAK